MKLGSSIRRRRRGGLKAFSWKNILPKKVREGSGGPRWAFLRDPRTLWMLAVLSVVGFAGGYLFSTRVVYPLPPPPGDLSSVPKLAGELPEYAADTLAAIGLVLGSVDSLKHPTVPAGRIVGQSPLPGQLSLVGDTVRIALSTGPEQRPVPDVVRLNGDRARTVLETSGFVVTVDSVKSDHPRGGVVSMRPEPGTEATIPMEVRLSVSMGPPQFAMPLLRNPIPLRPGSGAGRGTGTSGCHSGSGGVRRAPGGGTKGPVSWRGQASEQSTDETVD